MQLGYAYAMAGKENEAKSMIADLSPARPMCRRSIRERYIPV
jgi:hypothetical protein